MKKVFVGLTGNFGSGKTTVLKIFRQLGARTLNSDSIVNTVWQPRNPIYQMLLNAYRREKKGYKGKRVSKKQVAALAFERPVFRRKIEKIIHPVVFKKIRLARRAKTGILVAEIPLLFETGFHRKTDFIITVKASPRKSMARLKNRGLTPNDWKLRANTQWPIGKKAKKSDAVIKNDRSLRETRRQVKAIWKVIKDLNKK